jgi:hypothetical protein
MVAKPKVWIQFLSVLGVMRDGPHRARSGTSVPVEKHARGGDVLNCV